MSCVVQSVLNCLSESCVKAQKLWIEIFAGAHVFFFHDWGRSPWGWGGLTALVKRPGSIPGWNGLYLKGGLVPADPWGNPYIYRSPGQRGAYDLVSFGADGQEGGTGTASDITSWTR